MGPLPGPALQHAWTAASPSWPLASSRAVLKCSLQSASQRPAQPACHPLPLPAAPLPPLPAPPQSKLFALLHAGLAYRYSRWQQTAALQTALVAAAMAQTAWQDVCRAPPLASPTGRHTVRTAASLLTNAHLLPLVYTAPASEPGSGGSGGGGSEEEEGGPLLLQVPEGVDQCRLLLTWVQASSVLAEPCLPRIALPLTAANLSDEGSFQPLPWPT